jgi:MoaA/NifB/PqqE/SkfB family radical SAM enzyme
MYYAKELGPHIKKDLFNNPSNFDLTHVDLRWSNRCNQACVYCGAENSTKWAKELGIKQKTDKDNIAKVKEYVFDNVENLKNVYLAGGEPLMMNENKEFLDLLYKKNKDVHLRVNTNLSNTRTGVFQLIQKFKNVHWIVSIESIEEEYEYIRFGGRWEDFVDNIKTISKFKKHKISFNMLHFILNYMSIFDCIKFLQGLGFHNNSFVLGPVYNPVYLNIKNLPHQAKKQVKRKLEDLIDEKPGFLLQNGLENLLKYLTDPGFYANIEEVKKQIKIMDNRRNLDSEKVFPILYKEVLN